jgi:23S rRNA (pseudouridine1915-N3)-methyltransferase
LAEGIGRRLPGAAGVLKLVLITVGKAKAPFADADAHYRKLLQRYQPVEVVEVRDELNIRDRLPKRAHLVAMDRGGRALSSRAWANWLEERRIDALDLCFILGGPRGLPEEVLDLTDERLSLGPQTMAHQLSRVALLEQLFRATKILAGEPYHR